MAWFKQKCVSIWFKLLTRDFTILASDFNASLLLNSGFPTNAEGLLCPCGCILFALFLCHSHTVNSCKCWNLLTNLLKTYFSSNYSFLLDEVWILTPAFKSDYLWILPQMRHGSRRKYQFIFSYQIATFTEKENTKENTTAVFK